MKKILLIEDRYKRQEMFQEDLEIDLKNYNDILDNVIYDKYDEVFELLKNGEFDFSVYGIVITHKSAFGDDNTKVLTYIENQCKKNSIPLVYFSGGIDANYYQKEDKFELFEINSKTLYSNNLLLFLEIYRKEGLKPGVLIYGLQWDINILCKMLQKLNIYIEQLIDESQLESFFYEDNPYIQKILYKMKDIKLHKPIPQNDEISKKEMKKLLKSMQQYIEKRVIYE